MANVNSQLEFPKSFKNGNMPTVIFAPYKYNFPFPNLLELPTPNKILSTTNEIVRLYLPGDFSETVNSTWGPEEVLTGMSNTSTGMMIANVEKFLKDQGNIGAKTVSQAKALSGKIPFPTDINIFQSVEPISLNFSFNMIPYDEDEGNEIIKIVKNFKKATLPTSYTENKATVLNFPDIWDILYVNINGFGLEKDQVYENMALTNCTVQYVSGTEGASVFSDNNPTQVRLNLTFQSIRKQFLTGA